MKYIFFDADDTLWYDAKYFKDIENKLIFILNKCKIDRSQIISTINYFHDIDIKGETGYANAVIKTAINYNIRGKDLTQLKGYIDIFLQHPLELIDGVKGVLENLNERKFIYTKGNYKEQMNKILKSNIYHYFDNIIVVPHKDKYSLSNMLKMLNINPEESVLIGNSITHDIIPATENNVSSIWFNHSQNYYGNNAILPNNIKEINNWNEFSNNLL